MVAEYFIQNLNALMAEKSIDGLNELARLSGVPQSTMSNWKKSKNIPGPDNLERLATFFNVEPHYFFMKPGTQNIVKLTEKSDDFSIFIDELAKKHLKDYDLVNYRESGGANAFIRVLRSNYESDSNIGFADWYIILVKKLGEYVNLDIVKKVRENAEKALSKKSGGDHSGSF